MGTRIAVSISSSEFKTRSKNQVKIKTNSASKTRVHFERSRRAFFMGLGFASTGLAILGAFLPLLPTVPFLLLAAFFFSKGSETWHDWLHNHKKFGPLLNDWHQRGAINKSAKIKSVLVIASSFLINIYTLHDRPVLLACIGVALMCSITFILTRPS